MDFVISFTFVFGALFGYLIGLSYQQKELDELRLESVRLSADLEELQRLMCAQRKQS